ncbi:restriction endonuclease subunit S [Thiolapillus sp.]|uniref:restriction endonuclease subunit S n=2 Tax=Thiolapillus sp. TaxID=2017437 RepID=UPI003AF9C95D
MMEQATFPRYDQYKSTDVKWLGDIPEHWSIGKIRAVTVLKSKKNQPDLPVLSVYRDYGVILKDSRDDNHNATSLDTSNYKVVDVGDLVVNKMQAWQGSMGISQYHGIVSPAYITCTVDTERVFPKFLHYLLRSQPYIGVYNALSYGVRVGQWDMHYKDFKHIPLPIPSREEQQRIGNFLDRKTAEIDEAIAKKQRLIELLKEQKAILINQAVTKGLNPDAPMRDSGVEWIGEVPKHWEIKRLGFLAKMLQTGPFGSQLHQEDYIEDGIPVINPSQLSNGKIVPDSKTTVSEKTARRLHRHMTMVGDIIFARRGEMGRCGLTTQGHEGYICGTGSILFRPNKLADSVFLTIALGSDFIRRFLQFVSVGATMDNLNTSILSKVPIPIPPKEEQLRIIDAVVQIQAEHQEVAKTLQIGINQLYEFKQSAIASVVTGKIKL